MTLGEALNVLTDREREVLIFRHGLDDGRTRTLKEVGAVFGVTAERIRTIESRAYRKLRPFSQELANFAEENGRLTPLVGRVLTAKMHESLKRDDYLRHEYLAGYRAGYRDAVAVFVAQAKTVLDEAAKMETALRRVAR